MAVGADDEVIDVVTVDISYRECLGQGGGADIEGLIDLGLGAIDRQRERAFEVNVRNRYVHGATDTTSQAPVSSGRCGLRRDDEGTFAAGERDKVGRAIAEPERYIADREFDGVAGLLEREVTGETLTEKADVDIVASDAQVWTSGNVEDLGFAVDFELLRYRSGRGVQRQAEIADQDEVCFVKSRYGERDVARCGAGKAGIGDQEQAAAACEAHDRWCVGGCTELE